MRGPPKKFMKSSEPAKTLKGLGGHLNAATDKRSAPLQNLSHSEPDLKRPCASEQAMGYAKARCALSEPQTRSPNLNFGNNTILLRETYHVSLATESVSGTSVVYFCPTPCEGCSWR